MPCLARFRSYICLFGKRDAARSDRGTSYRDTVNPIPSVVDPWGLIEHLDLPHLLFCWLGLQPAASADALFGAENARVESG